LHRSCKAAFGGGFFATLLVGLFLAIVLGYFLEWAFYSYLYEREHLQQVLMTYGLILVFEELRSLIIGDDVHGVSAPNFLIWVYRLGRYNDLPGLSPFHECSLYFACNWHVLGIHPNKAWHDDPSWQ